MRSLLLLFLVLTSPLSAQTWTRTDTVLEITFQSLLLIDWRQTSNFHQCKTLQDGCVYRIHEHNMFISNTANQSQINTLFLLSAIGHLWVSLNVEPRARRV